MLARFSMEKSIQHAVAVVLGGGAEDDALAHNAGVAAKALVSHQGRSMGAHVLQALRESEAVRASIYVGPTEPTIRSLAEAEVMAGRSLADSLALGLGAALGRYQDAERILVVTADLPWLEASAIDDFVARAPEADLCYPAISKRHALEQFPGQRRTYARLREGPFTGGNLMLIKPSFVPVLLPFVDRAYRGRKNPLALASLIGFGTLLKFLTGHLSIPDLERSLSRRLGGELRAVISPHACLGADADKPEHLATKEPVPHSQP